MRFQILLPAMLLAMAGIAGAQPYPLELNTDRPGNDYNAIELEGGPELNAGLQQCINACVHDDRCAVVTYVKAGVHAPNPRCMLKDRVPAGQGNSCCVSWIRGGPPGVVVGHPVREDGSSSIPQRMQLQYGTNYMGSDFRDWEMTTSHNTPEYCRDECEHDPQCRAFTWVRPGVQGNGAHCWLKNTVPVSNRDDNTISGHKH